MNIVDAKGAMVAVAKHLSVPLKPMDMNEGVWGQNAQANCLKLTKAFGWPNPSTKFSPKLQKELAYRLNLPGSSEVTPPPKPAPAPAKPKPAPAKPKPAKPAAPKPAAKAKAFSIKHDYHAVHHSGNRSLSAIHFIVLHDMENTSFDNAAENVGAYFEMQASGGSTHYGIDDNSIQQYLSLEVIPWGAPYANTTGVHIEQMGKSSWDEKTWLKHPGTLERTAWLVHKLCKELGIPLRLVDVADVRNGVKGVTTHHICTDAFHIAGGHTDPGPGYPIGHVMDLAKKL